MTPRLLMLVAGCTLTAGVVLAQDAPPQPVAMTLPELERMALQSHPSLAKAAASIDAAANRAKQAGAWPNPSIFYVGEEIAGGEINRGGEHGVSVEQKIPLGGKLRLSREALEADITEAEAEQERERLMVLREVRAAYHEVLAAQLRVEVRERLANLAREATQVSAQLFNIGAADRPDVLTADIESALARVGLADAQSGLARAWTRLASAIAQPSLPQRAVAGTLDSPLPELARDQSLATALSASPELAASRARVVRAERDLARSRKLTFPDLLFSGGPRYNRELLEPGRTPVGLEWAFEAGFTVPLWDRNRSGVSAATSRVAAMKAAVAALELRLVDQHARLYDDYAAALRRAEAYRAEVLPKADEVYQLYLTKYREMAAAYPQVLAAQRTLFDATEQYIDAVERVRTSAVRLEHLVLEDGASR